MGKRKLSMRMWGYLPAASLQRKPLLKPTPVSQHGLQEEVRSVCGGGCGFGLAITESGKMSMWGTTNDLGQPSDLRRTQQVKPYLLDMNSNIVQAAGGWAHSVAVTDKGNVYTWGWSACAPIATLTAEQQLGVLATSTSQGNQRTEQSEESRLQHLSSSNEIQLNLPGCEHIGLKGPARSDKVGHTLKRRRGLDTEEAPLEDDTSTLDGNVMSPPSLVFMASGVIINSVAAGGRHTLALSDEGKVWGWGYCEEGQLGLGSRLGLISTPQHIKHLEAPHWTSDGSRNPNKSGFAEVLNLPAAIIGTFVTRIACGGRHSVVLTDAGAVMAFGWGLYGQCGQGNTEDQLSPAYVSALGGIKVTGLSAGLWHTLLITDQGDVYANGGNQFGQLGTFGDHAEMLPTLVDTPLLENEIATSVSCGARHTAILTDNGKIFGWGWNKYGQLGIGDTINRDTAVEIPLENAVVKSVVCGWWHTLALVEEELF